MDSITQSLAHLIASLENDGGAFTITGIVLVGIFVLATSVINAQRKESADRDIQWQRYYDDIQRRNDEVLGRERENTQKYQHQTDRVIDVIERNTEAITTLVTSSNRQDELLNRIDKHFTRPAQPHKETPPHKPASQGGEHVTPPV